MEVPHILHFEKLHADIYTMIIADDTNGNTYSTQESCTLRVDAVSL
jgi:hypothetical protein